MKDEFEVLSQTLWPLGPDAPPEKRLAATFSAYQEATGIRLTTNPSSIELRAVRDWLVNIEVASAGGLGIALLTQRATYLKPLIHADIASKTSWIRQTQCTTCLLDSNSTPQAVYFGIRTRPFSAQSMAGSDLAVLKKRISDSLEQRFKLTADWSKANVCLSVVAVVSARDRLKDVDNMVKGLIDAIQGHLYFNDNQVAHLSIHRVVHEGPEGHYLLGVSPVLQPLADVVYPKLNLGWAGQQEINLI